MKEDTLHAAQGAVRRDESITLGKLEYSAGEPKTRIYPALRGAINNAASHRAEKRRCVGKTLVGVNASRPLPSDFLIGQRSCRRVANATNDLYPRWHSSTGGRRLVRFFDLFAA